jgi:hypothetical protein
MSAAVQPPAAPTAKLPDTPGARLLASVRHPGDLSAGERKLAETNDETYLHWLSWSVTALKLRHQIDVYYKGRLFRSYHAVFGRNPDHGAKLFEGDFRTPEGVYWIVKKHDSARWHRFLGLNYPNYVDRRRFLEKVQAGEVPLEDGEQPSPGGQIGIHGTDEPRFNHWDINWTAGCISVDNDAVLELDRILPVGTIVIIKP